MTTESHQYKNINEDEISLKELIIKVAEWCKYLLSKWLIILAFTVMGCILGFYYASTKKPVYTATTTFVLEDQKTGGLGNLAGLASIAGVDLGSSGGGIFQGENILGLYKSRTMIEKTLLSVIDVGGKNELLVDRYIHFNQLREKWKNKPEIKNLSFPIDSIRSGNYVISTNRLRDSILGVIVADINKNYLIVFKPDKKLSTIQIDVKANDEIFAKRFNEGLVKIVNQFYINTKTKKTLQNVEILQHKADSVRSAMNGAIYNAVAVADATPNLNPTKQVQRIAPAQRSQFSAETNKAILSTLVQNLEMSKMALMKDAPLLEIVDMPVYPLEVTKMGKLKGMVFGGFCFAMIISVLLILRMAFKDITK
ncbi:Wzz/FepE/Etk N-terminal domain-containing protein [Pedobacter jamesrossensis]|uniref:Wzz/FepE/Etk N-terminal domain-containing protein n=1 Tax=Pedobacter jamesrossensis TaxID=1908238 RepID=A0ABV8NLE3_9SPHI